ncbi:glycosyltransferase family A protein [Xanthomonas sp. 3075]|uniref:glycosyltransferase n=1 Tax=Xanthomonas sp. 3075 TaxID=3035315 RepID=UPI00160B8502|nr:glycosyltransferase family A protein [Xanthomonas sp. 3075]MBB4132066.1 glycosyltransferase involved in cell wall biosynthesis [Xanthomonas sp. 3075]
MIAVTIPAHNEAALIGQCLQSVLLAARHPQLGGEPVEIHVALDRCTDMTGAIARAHGAMTLKTSGGVGMARGAAASVAIARGARWLAFTDADSCVPPDWLTAQLGCAADVFCGVVEVTDWHDFRPETQHAFLQSEIRQDGHPHVHGANLGMSTAAYLAAGGFSAVTSSEDVELVSALERAGMQIARLVAPVVNTSARRNARATGGFSEYLLRLEAQMLATTPVPIENS